MSKTAVLALGGNALTREGQAGTFEEQAHNALVMAGSVGELIRAGWRIVIVHGNGPQVGNLAIQQEEGGDLVPPQPLPVLGAMTQGALGSLICLALDEVCGSEIPGAVAVVSHVVVDAHDPAFLHPTKPIGPFFDATEADELARTRGWTMVEDAGRGHRRVVPSPRPINILEADSITRLIEAGHVVVAAGGGGIPVAVDADGHHRGVDAVIDKDLAAEKLARAIDADALVLVTGVSAVKLDFGTAAERSVHRMTVGEARQHLADGQFPPGSMGPKIIAAASFVEEGGRFSAITTPELVAATLDGVEHGEQPGTVIIPSDTTSEVAPR